MNRRREIPASAAPSTDHATASPEPPNPDAPPGARGRSVRRGALAGAAARVVSLVIGLITVPLLLRHLGAEQFGVWATITSLITLLSFADLGLSNGLVNVIADSDARNDRAAIVRGVSSAIVLLCSMAATLMVLVLIASRIIDLGALVGYPGSDAARDAVIVFAACFLANLPCGMMLRISMGMQETGVAYAWIAAGSTLGLLANVVAVKLGGSLVAAVAATSGAPAVAGLLNGLALFGRRRRWMRPRLSAVSRATMRYLVGSGLLFFVTQTSMAISYQSDALIIGNTLGAGAVTRYTVPMRAFYFLPVVLNFALLPLWPAVRNAIAHGDVPWVKTAFARVAAVSIGAIGAATVALLLAAPHLIALWTGHDLGDDRGLLYALAGWAMTSAVTTPLAYLLAGLNANAFIAVTYAAMAVVNLPLSIALVHSGGVKGVVLGTVIADVACLIVPSVLYVPKLFARLERLHVASVGG